MAEETRQAGSFTITSSAAAGLTADTDLFGTKDGRVVMDQNDPDAHELIARKGQAIHPRHAEQYGLAEGKGSVSVKGPKAQEPVPSSAAPAEAPAAPAEAAPGPGPEEEPEEKKTRKAGSVTVESTSEK